MEIGPRRSVGLDSFNRELIRRGLGGGCFAKFVSPDIVGDFGGGLEGSISEGVVFDLGGGLDGSVS